VNLGKGCRKPDPVKLAAHPDASEHPHVGARLAAHGSGAAPLSPEADKLPTAIRLNQGQSSSCTWGSSSRAAAITCESVGAPLGWIPSQRVGYAATRAEERAKIGALGPLEDGGADLEDIFLVMATEGVEPMKCATTPDGRAYDIWTDADTGGSPPGNVNDELDPVDLEASMRMRILVDVRPHTISPSDSSRSDKMAAALDGAPAVAILVAAFVDSAFENLRAGQIARAPNLSDPRGGGHALHVTAYRPDPARPGKRQFRVENSWGEWCEPAMTRADGVVIPGGYVWASEEWCAALWAIYVFDPQVVKLVGADRDEPTRPDLPNPPSMPPRAAAARSRVVPAVRAGGMSWPRVLGGLSFALAALWALGCPPVAPVAPGPDADAAPLILDDGAPPSVADCVTACTRLAQFGCPGATDPNCPAAFTLYDVRQLRRTPAGVPLTCAAVAAASTKASILALGLPCP
jgi:hypothetical protein